MPYQPVDLFQLVHLFYSHDKFTKTFLRRVGWEEYRDHSLHAGSREHVHLQRVGSQEHGNGVIAAKEFLLRLLAWVGIPWSSSLGWRASSTPTAHLRLAPTRSGAMLAVDVEGRGGLRSFRNVSASMIWPWLSETVTSPRLLIMVDSIYWFLFYFFFLHEKIVRYRP